MASQEKKKSAKAGRNMAKCARYRAQGRREKNKARKMWKQWKRCEDKETLAFLYARYPSFLRSKSLEDFAYGKQYWGTGS